MSFFEYIIAPFIFLIEKLFLLSYQLCGNYGLAIILLSFFISLLLLPVFMIIEKSKKKDDHLKQKMKPLIDEIKRVYKGQERFYYIKTIQRQHHYNAMKALIPILSLLLQIPFFIAAYQFLEHFEPLEGVSFLFIKDLSLPDGTPGVMNILPVLMTIVNLITAFFYTRNGNTSERKQMVIVAGAFLILLYNLPAGLVLYWTMNNVFSFFRLFITNREVFRGIHLSANLSALMDAFRKKWSVLKRVFIITGLIAVATQINWALQFNFNDIVFRLFAAIIFSFLFTIIVGLSIMAVKKYAAYIINMSVKPMLYFSLLFLSAYFYFASTFYYSGLNQNLAFLALMCLVPLQFLGFLYLYQLKRQGKSHAISTFLIILITLLQLMVLYSIFSYDQGINFSFFGIKLKILQPDIHHLIEPGLISSFIISIYFLKNFSNLKKPGFANAWLIYLLALLYITGFVFFWNPLITYTSSPTSFGFPAIEILSKNLVVFIISLFSGLILYLILPSKYKRGLTIFLLFVLIISIINSTIVPLNLGTLQQHRLSNINNLLQPEFIYILEGLLMLGLLFLLNRLYVRKHETKFILFLIILNIATISYTVNGSLKTNSFFSSPFETEQTYTDLSEQDNSNDEDKFIYFSNEQENVLVIILDMVQGWYLWKMMEDDPQLKTTFSGFTWYPNTVSISNYTAPSSVPIMGGFNMTPDKMNRDSTLTLQEKIEQAYQILQEKATSESFSFYNSPIGYSRASGTRIPFWRAEWDYAKSVLNIGQTRQLKFKLLWQNAFFYSMPLFIKPKIYNEGNWMMKKAESNENTELTKHYNLLRVVPYVSKVKTGKPSFIFFWSNASHFPWDLIDEEGNFVPNVTPYENNFWAINKTAKWIDWMKKNDVYDNTKIIILSDHGIRDTEITEEVMVLNPFNSETPKNISMKELLYFTPLMMVKDYNATGPIKEDWRLLSNVDTYNIAFNENDPTKINPPVDRTLNAYTVSWRLKTSVDKLIPIDKVYEVRDTVYNTENWKLISE